MILEVQITMVMHNPDPGPPSNRVTAVLQPQLVLICRHAKKKEEREREIVVVVREKKD